MDHPDWQVYRKVKLDNERLETHKTKIEVLEKQLREAFDEAEAKSLENENLQIQLACFYSSNAVDSNENTDTKFEQLKLETKIQILEQNLKQKEIELAELSLRNDEALIRLKAMNNTILETHKTKIEVLEKQLREAFEEAESKGSEENVDFAKLEQENKHLNEMIAVLQMTLKESAGVQDRRVVDLEEINKNLQVQNDNLDKRSKEVVVQFENTLASKDKEIKYLTTKMSEIEQNVKLLQESAAKHKNDAQNAQIELEKALTERNEMNGKLTSERNEMKQKISNLRKEWEDLARRHYQDEIESSGRRFRLLLKGRDLGFLEFEKSEKQEEEEPKVQATISRSSSFDVVNGHEDIQNLEQVSEEDSLSDIVELTKEEAYEEKAP
uniref:Uncharacterized protein n=1 Tax=Acrobeloides nanus TaxID=290746 RepID=A0A914DQM7_9BILA